MKKKIIAALALSCIAAGCLAACNTDSHEHTYASEWTKTKTEHYYAATCEHTDEKKDAGAHDKKGENGACSVCGYKVETPAPAHTHDWGEWTVDAANKPTATTEGKATRTCSAEGCNEQTQEITLPVLTSDEYVIVNDTATIESAGTGTYWYYGSVITVSFTAPTPIRESQTFTVTVEGAGAGVKIWLGEYAAETNAEGVATIKAEKIDYSVVVETNGYKYHAAKITADEPTAIVKLPTAVGGGSATSVQTIGVGLYTTTITAREDSEIEGKYVTFEKYFGISCAGNAKTYTVKVLSENTTIVPDESGYSSITEAGENYSIVMEVFDRTTFGVSSNDEDVTEGYRYKVVFEITESEAPEKGVYDRPVRLENDIENATAVADENQKVYYKLDYATFGKYAKITFGEGVTVYSLGYNKSGAGTAITSGSAISIGEYAPAYLYAVSTGENCAVTAQIHYVDGMKEKPIDITAGEENEPAISIDNSVYEQWYKLQVAENGTYIIKANASHAVLEVYNDVNGEPVSIAQNGAAISVVLTANTPVYIRAASSLNTKYIFTATEFSDADRGLSAAEPLELTASGEYTVYDTHYYKFTATVNSKVVISYNNGVQSYSDILYIYVHSDNTYDNAKLLTSSGFNNKVEFFATAGETYYFHTEGGAQATQNTFKFEVSALAVHDYIITVTDGTDTYDNVTVSVMKVKTEVANGVTVNGQVTLSLLPDNYTLVLTGIPAGYGYYQHHVTLGMNNDETTEFEAKITALADYSLTVKLPDGSAAVGLTVTFTNSFAGTYTAVTDTDGVAKITQLPPMTTKPDGSIGTGGYYTVSFEFTGDYENYTFKGNTILLSTAEAEKEVSISVIPTYTYTLTYSDGDETKAVEAGTQVSICKFVLGNPTFETIATETVGANGVVKFKFEMTTNASYCFVLDNDFVTSAQVYTNSAQLTADITCSKVKSGFTPLVGLLAAGAYSSESELQVGENLTNVQSANYRYFKFTATKSATYTFTYEDINSVNGNFAFAFLNGSATSSQILKCNVNGVTNNSNGKLTYSEEDKVNYGYKTITITLEEGDVFIVGPSTSEIGYGYITITEVTD